MGISVNQHSDVSADNAFIRAEMVHLLKVLTDFFNANSIPEFVVETALMTYLMNNAEQGDDNIKDEHIQNFQTMADSLREMLPDASHKLEHALVMRFQTIVDVNDPSKTYYQFRSQINGKNYLARVVEGPTRTLAGQLKLMPQLLRQLADKAIKDIEENESRAASQV